MAVGVLCGLGAIAMMIDRAPKWIVFLNIFLCALNVFLALAKF
jgi:hypothetical protein